MTKANDEKPTVSIIMPSFNAEATLSDSIKSVQAQTLSDWELLITDDNSTDRTYEIALEFAAQDPRIKVFQLKKNRGAGMARNYSIEHARGRFIAFLDSDDLWLPEKLEKQLDFMRENDATLAYTAYQKFSSQGNRGVVHVPRKVAYRQLLRSCAIGCLTAMYDTEKTGGKRYMSAIRKRQDYALWLSILKSSDYAWGLDEVLAKYRSDRGMTANKFTVFKYQWAVYRDLENVGLMRSCWYFLNYAVQGYLKHLK